MEVKGAYRYKLYSLYESVFPNLQQELIKENIEGKNVSRTRVMLKDQSSIFQSNWATSCQKKRQPILLFDEEEIEQAKEDGKDLMSWPLYGEENNFPFTFACDHTKHPYVGLQENNILSNKNIYPYTPCCFTNDQLANRNSIRYQYENNEGVVIPKDVKNTKLYISGINSIPVKSIGSLLPNIEKFLTVLYPGAFPLSTITFNRVGSLKSSSSALDAIIRVVLSYWSNNDEYKKFLLNRFPFLEYIFTQYSKASDEEMEEYFIKLRKNMVNVISSNILAQSSFNIDIEKIKGLLEDPDEYLDIRLFWRLLEEIFNVNIFLFRYDISNTEGDFSTPYSLHEYLQYKPIENEYRISVILFETTGGRFNNLKYPQVEVIQHKVKDTVYYWYDSKKDKKFLHRLKKCFDEIHNSRQVDISFKSIPKYQCSDPYGKIRFIQFDDICVQTDPLPTIPINQTANSCNFEPVDINTAIDFMKKEDIVINKQIVHNNLTTMISGTKNNVDIYISVLPTKQLEVSTENLIQPVSKDSSLNHMYALAKLARYLTEYVVFIFSVWYSTTKKPITKDNIRKFVNMFEINPDIKYPSYIPRKLDRNLSNLVNDNKLIVESNIIRNRLIYALLLRLSQDQNDVINYKNRIYMKNYYQNVSDFTFRKENIIIKGKENLNNWIMYKLPEYIIYDHVYHPVYEKKKRKNKKIKHEEDEEEDDEELKQAKQELKKLQKREEFEKGNADELALENLPLYLIRLPKLDGIYIAQQASDIENALYISSIWHTKHYNIGRTNNTLALTSFKYVVYNSIYDYEIIDMGGNESKYVILQYKFKDNIYTLALLKI